MYQFIFDFLKKFGLSSGNSSGFLLADNSTCVFYTVISVVSNCTAGDTHLILRGCDKLFPEQNIHVYLTGLLDYFVDS